MKNTKMKYDLDETKVYLAFLSTGLIVTILGVAYIYSEILFPAPKPTFSESVNMIISLFVLMVGLSFVLHGFHPILLVKTK